MYCTSPESVATVVQISRLEIDGLLLEGASMFGCARFAAEIAIRPRFGRATFAVESFYLHPHGGPRGFCPPPHLEDTVTKYATHKTPKLIARGKLTFDGRVVVHRVDGTCPVQSLHTPVRIQDATPVVTFFRLGCSARANVRKRLHRKGFGVYLTQSVDEVVLHKSTPPQIHRPILYCY